MPNDDAKPPDAEDDSTWQFVRPSGIRVFILGWACALELGLLPALVAMTAGMFVGVALYDLTLLLVGYRQIRSLSDIPLMLLWQLAVIGYFPISSWLIALTWRSSGKEVPDWRGTWEIARSAGERKPGTPRWTPQLPSRTNRAGISLSDATELGAGSPAAIMCFLSAPMFFALTLFFRWLSELSGA